MKTIENTTEMEAALYIQYGSILEESASALTQGKSTFGVIEGPSYPWPK